QEMKVKHAPRLALCGDARKIQSAPATPLTSRTFHPATTARRSPCLIPWPGVAPRGAAAKTPARSAPAILALWCTLRVARTVCSRCAVLRGRVLHLLYESTRATEEFASTPATACPTQAAIQRAATDSPALAGQLPSREVPCTPVPRPPFAHLR